MRGHAFKRGSTYGVVLEPGPQSAQRCPVCLDKRGRSKRHWIEFGRLEACPTCGGPLEEIVARRQIWLPERYRLKKDALAALTRELNADLNGIFVEPDKLTLGEYLLEHWLPSIEESVRATTLISYRAHVERHIVPFLGAVPLRKLSPTAINAFNAALRSQPRKPRTPRRGAKTKAPEAGSATTDAQADTAPPRPLSEGTRRHVYVTLVTSLNAAVAQGLLAVNPTTRSTAPQRHDTRELHTWSDQELRAFLEATREERLHALWRLLAMTGMRRGEALGLKWPDVDFAGARVSIQRSRVIAGARVLEHPPKTRTGRRAVPLDALTLATLRTWKARQAAERLAWGPAWLDSGYVFTREDGEPLHPGFVTKRFREAVAATTLPRIRLHDLRHTCATLLLAAGVHAKVVQERLGHATISQTLDIYSHTTPSLHVGAAEKLATIVDGTP
jgi:integrase